MKFTKSGLVTLAILACTGNASAEFFYYFGSNDPTDTGTANTTTNIPAPGPGDTVSVALAEAAWERQVALLYPSLTIANFKTNATNVKNASSGNAVKTAINSNLNNINLSNPTTPTGTGSDHSNATLGLATFDSLADKNTPSFTIQAHETRFNNYGGVFFNDTPTGKAPETDAGWKDKLSIGKFNGFSSSSGLDTRDYHNDDFTFEITGGDVLYAFAFHIINNKKNSNNNESFDVVTSGTISTTVHFGDDSNDGTNGLDGLMLDINGDIVEPGDSGGVVTISGSNTDIPGYNSGQGEGLVLFDHDDDPDTPDELTEATFTHESFIGIVTDDISEVFSLLNFNEGSGANDIGIFDFRFAVAPSAVPVPAAVWLFGSGLLALLGLRRR